jgi:hypothetical protein
MKSNEKISTLTDGVFCIENFLFPETCDFLVSIFSDKDLNKSDKDGVFGAFGQGEHESFNLNGAEKIFVKTDVNKKIGIDFFTGILTNIEKTTSEIFNKNLLLKSYFYSHMKKGGKNDLHVDNYNKKYSNDYSAILYLTDSYSGGEINFPERKLNIKPKPGTLITFIGTKDLAHEVKEVIDGDRVNLICFLNNKERSV